ncbi:hypothetical protein Y032_0138g2061 [Ancylostoma ceylanicum]|uniref:C-type lectin domain-containing protein n=1 Tax=Ancylostoma ceylanicum TaxID=53326 RepID=A0A016T4T2_9BILA|nr:hypothetical protein Y032_0138g2061 [Ancylostoma ceylanicum]
MFSHLLHFGIVCVLASQVHGKLCKGIKGGGCELLNTVVSGKCIYLCNVRGQVNFNSARRICEGAHLGGNVLSISNEFENELVKGFLAYQGVSTAFIGRTWTGYEWVWTNNDASTFVPTTTTTTTTTTTATTTTDAPREVALVVVIDATEQNGRHNALQEVDFANSLTRYILERGSAEFAFVKYGCYPPSFPPFHSTSSDLSNDMKEINSSIHKQCFQKQGRTFAQTYDDLSWFYYSNYPERLHISKNMAVIIFTSTNDSRSIADLVPMTTIPHSVVITISVGKDAADTSRLSVPQFSNHIAVNDLSDTDRLVEDVDEMIFTSLRDYREKIAADSSRLSVPQFSNHIAVNDLSSTDKLVEDVDEMIFTSLRDYREKIGPAHSQKNT